MHNAIKAAIQAVQRLILFADCCNSCCNNRLNITLLLVIMHKYIFQTWLNYANVLKL